MFRHGLLMAVFFAGFGGTAAAQCTTCGTAGAAGGQVGPGCNHHGGLRQYPTFDSHYIKDRCFPTICPGSCYGHFQTQWTPWALACPAWTPGTLPYNPALVNTYPTSYGPTVPDQRAAVGPKVPEGSEPVPAPRPTTPDEPVGEPAPVVPMPPSTGR